MQKKSFRNLANLFVCLLILALFAPMSSCLKDKTFDELNVNTNPDGWQIKMSNTALPLSVFNVQANVNTVLWLYNPNGTNIVSATWTFGDGSSTASGWQVNHIWTTVGTYTVSVTFTPVGGNPQTMTATIIVGAGVPTNTTSIVLISATSTGNNNYMYNLAASTATIFNFEGLSGNSWVRDNILGWVSPTSFNNTIIIDGQKFITFSIERANGEEVLQYGRDGTWSFGAGFDYWQTDGGSGGTYHLMLYNGQITNNPGSNAQPGVSGDPYGASNPPTIRYDIEANPNQNLSDSLVVYFNNQVYGGSNVNPFYMIKYSTSATWISGYQKIVVGTGWGYIKIAIDYIAANGNILYFQFGPNYSNLSSLADVTNSNSYIPSFGYCGIQTAGQINSPGINYLDLSQYHDKNKTE